MGRQAAAFTLVRADGVALAGRPWRVDGDLAGGTNLSGIACDPDGRGLVATDEGSRLQEIRLNRATRTLHAGATLPPLLQPGEEADIEGLCWIDGCFLATGSHARGRSNSDHQPARYHVYRLAPAAGDDGWHHETSHGLGPLLAADRVLGDHYQRRLDRKRRGVDVEGLAARGGRLWFGLRSPALDGRAFVLEVAAADLFGCGPGHRPRPRRHALAVGRRAGIRDLAAVPGGLLVLSGPSVKGDRTPFAVWLWNDRGRLAPLARFAELGDAKAEGLLVLGANREGFEVLILFDGVRHGRPHHYRLPHPA